LRLGRVVAFARYASGRAQAYCKTFVRDVGSLNRNEPSMGRDKAAKECAGEKVQKRTADVSAAGGGRHVLYLGRRRLERS